MSRVEVDQLYTSNMGEEIFRVRDVLTGKHRTSDPTVLLKNTKGFGETIILPESEVLSGYRLVPTVGNKTMEKRVVMSDN